MIKNRAKNPHFRGISGVRERGIPERINRNSLGVMVGPGPLGNAIVLLCCFRGVACRHRQVGSDEQDLGRKTWGGRCPRGWGEGVSPLNGEGAWAPGSVPGPRPQSRAPPGVQTLRPQSRAPPERAGCRGGTGILLQKKT